MILCYGKVVNECDLIKEILVLFVSMMVGVDIVEVNVGV